MEKKTSQIENEYVHLWIEDDIIHAFFKVEKITLEMAEKIVEDRLRLTNRVSRPVLLYSNNVKSIDKKARDFLASEESTKYISASAMLVDNYVTWMLGKLFISFNKPKFHSEIFRTTQKAIEWLKNFRYLN